MFRAPQQAVHQWRLRGAAQYLALAAALCCGHAARGAEPLKLSLCIDNNNFPPFIFTDRDGQVPILLKMAGKETGFDVQFHRAPFRRCLAEIRSGQADGYPSAPFLAQLAELLAYPGAQGQPDPALAVAVARQMVYRRKGDAVQWDGNGFSGLQGPVLFNSPALLIAERIQRYGVATDNAATRLETNFDKLLAHRGDAVIGFEASAAPLLLQPAYKDKVEGLPLPFVNEPYYLAVSHGYLERHGAAVQALWQALGRVRQSAAYKAAVKDLPSQ